MKKIFVTVFCFITSFAFTQNAKMNKFIDSLMKQMTLEEKLGQMNQYNGDFEATGPITKDSTKQQQIKKGLVGSFLNIKNVQQTRQMQDVAMQSRLKIPLLFGQDVIHGYRTIFPIPLAEAASWNLDAMEQSARVAATEAAACGIHWTFAPMVDIARDPRWGRVMEGAGEDTYLACLIAKARVKGFQGKGLGNIDAVMACAKHFAAYGAAIGGRDYNSVDMSLKQLHEIYLPPFKAAVDAGAATLMNSFNDLNGIPATASSYLQRDILKKQWNFKGFVVSDWGSIGEMIEHGFAKDNYEAALLAANAGSDMDMESRSYIKHLAQLVKEGKVKISVIDEAVKRILIKKYELGLFTNAYKFCDEEREKQQWNNAEHLKIARDVAKKSIVLLKNEKKLLPLKKDIKSIALIGPFVKDKFSNNGFWSYDWKDDSIRITSLYEGIQKQVSSSTELLYAKGCNINDDNKNGFAEAISIAEKAEVIILSIGEARDMSGEAKSRSNIHLPGVQEDLVKALKATGKPMIVLINAGRPLIFNYTADNADAILYTWWLGTEAGNAIADVLFGSYNPSGKLPITFPRAEGQIPIYYNHYNTGRPAYNDKNILYRSAYIDLSITPKYVFGYGLSYANFKYSAISLSSNKIAKNQKITATISITNTSEVDGTETVQLYIRDLVASMVRPVKELKGYQQIFLKAGETKTIQFNITENELKFLNNNLQYIIEPGEFEIMIGTDSEHFQKVTINWVQ